MIFGSLFAGIGGFDLGLERAGMTCAWQVEIDDYATKVLEKHWPNVQRFRDIRECGAHNLPAVDLICGGFPCQPFSQAGKRRGAEDDRYLWPEMLRVIQAVGPRWVVAENVRGLVTQDGGVEFEHVLLDLESLGYDTQPFIIPACAVDARHRRDRVWIVGNAKDISRNGWENTQECNGTQEPAGGSSGYVANPEAWGLQERPSEKTVQQYAECGSLQKRGDRWQRWNPEPDVGRVAHGISRRVDRLKCLGNAVIPQIVEAIGRTIIDVEKNCSNK